MFGRCLSTRMVCCLLTCAGAVAEPPFRNSIVSTEFDFITADDPSVFAALKFVGRRRCEMPDKRTEELFADGTFVFEAGFSDGTNVEIRAHGDLGSRSVAEHYAAMLSGPLGRLPELMRRRISHVVIHNGNETAFAEHEGHFFVLYSENMDVRVRNHDLEETVFHESVHAALDAEHNRSQAWLSAQEADGQFVTQYAAENPAGEDLPESALFAYTVLQHPGRLPPEVETWVHQKMPYRMAFFRELFRGSEQREDHASTPERP